MLPVVTSRRKDSQACDERELHQDRDENCRASPPYQMKNRNEIIKKVGIEPTSTIKCASDTAEE